MHPSVSILNHAYMLRVVLNLVTSTIISLFLWPFFALFACFKKSSSSFGSREPILLDRHPQSTRLRTQLPHWFQWVSTETWRDKLSFTPETILMLLLTFCSSHRRTEGVVNLLWGMKPGLKLVEVVSNQASIVAPVGISVLQKSSRPSVFLFPYVTIIK